ncbi:MAG: cytidine deaminase [bacterium]
MDKNILDKAIQTALKVRENAHSPYSEFKVGAVIISKKNELFQGVNVENSSFGATVCAERTALFNAVTSGCKELKAVVVASNLNGKAVFPCGICRQVLADFNPDLRVILVNSGTLEVEREMTLSEIFPETFNFPDKERQK